jgi:hypothetical protein
LQDWRYEQAMYTAPERERLRQEILGLAQSDPRISGGALTGSASLGKEDRWSDIDLAFAVRSGSDLRAVLDDYSGRMYKDHGALHHLDVLSGTWIYRVFLLPNTLQVDLAFAPEEDFGPRGPAFKLLFGDHADRGGVVLVSNEQKEAEILIGWAWLYALHARSCIARRKLWQAEYMVSGMRDQVLALACLRHGLPTREGRGFDLLPLEVTSTLNGGLVRWLDYEELILAFGVVTDALVTEAGLTEPQLTARLEPTLRALADFG